MFIRYFFTAMLFVGIFATTYAQNPNMTQTIYLNDGSVLKGTILNPTDAEVIQVKLTSGQLIELEGSSIDKIKEGKANLTYVKDGKAIKEKGYFSDLTMGFLMGQETYSDIDNIYLNWGFNLHTIHGYKFNKFIAIGVGTGFDVYGGFDIIPLYASFRSYPFSKKVSPYFGWNGGYGFAPEFLNNNSSDEKGGFLSHPLVGLRFASIKGNNFFLELGQKFQFASRESNWGNSKDDIVFMRTSVNFGWSF